MNNEYKEPVFKVVVASAQDVITTSGVDINNYTPTDPFESGLILD